MNNVRDSKFIEKYISLAIEHREGTNQGDFRKTNKAYDALTKLFKQLQNDDKLADSVLPILLRSEDIRVRSFAAAHSIGLGKFTCQAENILNEVSHDKRLGILSFNAGMTLKVWKDQGYLKF